ncbi:MAG: coenzyme F420-0:L-glutamate ligase, partial [Candidatus Alkanophagales archaeon]
MRRIEIIGVESLPEIKPGDDIVVLFLEAIRREGISLQDHDVVI